MKLRSKLLWFCSALLLLPWLGYHYLQDMQLFLLRGQESAQQLTAQAVATLLRSRETLLLTTDLPADREALYAWPTDQFMLVDGYDDDWDQRIVPLHFGPEPGVDGSSELALTLRLAQREDQLFIMAQVRDGTRVYRHPGISALDSSDHLRLAFRYQGQARRYVIAVEAIGEANIYPADARWRVLEADPGLSLRANWQETSAGYQVEIALPVALLEQDSRLWLAAVDVEDGAQRKPAAMVVSGSNLGRPVHLHAPELQRLIAGLRQPGRHIRVLDRHGVVRAVSNLRSATPELLTRAEQSFQRALDGRSIVDRYSSSGQRRILVAEPIRGAGDAVMGVVMVEVATRDILELQRSTLLKTAALTAAVFLLILLALLLFGARLTHRIRQLGRHTRASLDQRGRVLRSALPPQQLGADELGALGADISTLLGRLYHYTRYLERLPRALRHELSNPLNTIGTSLQMLRDSPLAAAEGRYIDSAERGVKRLSRMLTSLTEAVSLEEALADERYDRVDLVALAERYIEQHRAQYGEHRLSLLATVAQAPIRGSELRLEQALDKLFDNAADYAPPASTLQLRLQEEKGGWRLALHNAGSAIPAELAANLFDSLVSGSDRGGADSPHLGMGLYVVRLIAEAHGGSVAAHNQVDGVEVALTLPRAD